METRKYIVGLFTTAILLLSANANSLTVGIDANMGAGTHDELLGTLQSLGHTVVEDGFTGVDVFINAAGSPSDYDLNNSVNLGIGFIQIGNWTPTWTTSSSRYNAAGPYDLKIDNSHAITAGLDSTWTEFGFHNNNSAFNPTDLPQGYLGWDTDSSHQSIVSTTSIFSRSRVITAEDLGTYRAVYIGVEAFGTGANANSIGLLDNSIHWTAASMSDAVPVPASAWLFGSAIGLLGWMRRRSV